MIDATGKVVEWAGIWAKVLEALKVGGLLAAEGMIFLLCIIMHHISKSLDANGHPATAARVEAGVSELGALALVVAMLGFIALAAATATPLVGCIMFSAFAAICFIGAIDCMDDVMQNLDKAKALEAQGSS